MSSLRVVTGAPGAGKTTTVEQLLTMKHSFTVFDIDWLVDDASTLIGDRIQQRPDTWQPYGQLWFSFLHATIKNGHQPIFFTPNTPADFVGFGIPQWCQEIHWLVLDCDDAERTLRLQSRGWNQQSITEAIGDASEQRELDAPMIDTTQQAPSDIASQIIRWADSMSSN